MQQQHLRPGNAIKFSCLQNIHTVLEHDGLTIRNDTISKQVQWLNRTSNGAECTKLATPLSNITPCNVHIVLIELVQIILLVLHQSHYFHHANPLALNKGVARFITMHTFLMTELMYFV